MARTELEARSRPATMCARRDGSRMSRMNRPALLPTHRESPTWQIARTSGVGPMCHAPVACGSAACTDPDATTIAIAARRRPVRFFQPRDARSGLSGDEKMRMCFIANPTAGRGRTRSMVESYARAVHGEVELLWTQRPGHARELAREAAGRVQV